MLTAHHGQSSRDGVVKYGLRLMQVGFKIQSAFNTESVYINYSQYMHKVFQRSS